MHSIFTIPSVDQADQKIRISELAMQDAKQGVPASSSTTLSGTEQSICNFIVEKVIANNRDLANQALGREHEERSNLHVHAPIAKIRSAVADTEAAIEAYEGGIAKELLPLKKDALITEAEYNYFRETNQIRRLPSYPESKVFHWSLILVVGFIETLLNGVFLSQGNEFGFVGGIAYAAIITVINIGLAGLVGTFALPYCWHRSSAKKLFGWLTLLLWVVIVGYLYLLFGHLRSAMTELDPNLLVSFEPGKRAWDMFLENPLGINDVWGWMLVLISAVIGIFALIKFLLADDVYPGYGEVHRRSQFARKAYEAATVQLTQDSLHRIRKAEDQLHVLRGEANRHLDKFKLSLHRSEELVTAYQNTFENAQTLYDNLIIRYRTKNSTVRSIPSPAYFERTERIDSSRFPELDTYQLEQDRDHLKPVEEEVKEVPTLYQAALEGHNELKRTNATRIKELLAQVENQARSAVSNRVD